MAIVTGFLLPLDGGGGGFVPRGTRVEVFSRIFDVFLILGTLVGVVVIAYMLYNAYVYRDGADDAADDADRPTLGEIPTGGGKGGKLFVSFGLSAIIVVSLIAWTYGTLLYVEQDSPVDEGEHLTVEVEGYQFGWSFTYPNGHTTTTLRLPANTPVRLQITARDVFHNFGIPELKVKSDAIPGQTTDTWLVTDEPAEYTANCYELCGSGHSFMQAPVVVMDADAYEEWYAGTSANGSNENETSGGNSTSAGDGDAHAHSVAEVSA